MLSEKEVLVIKKIDEGTGASGPGSGVGFRKNTTIENTAKRKKQQKDDGSGKPGDKVPPRKFVTVAPIYAITPGTGKNRGKFRREMLPDIQTYTDE